MPEKRRQQRHRAVDVLAGLEPAEQGVHGKGMSQVVGPRSGTRALTVQADLTDQRGERLVQLVTANPATARGEEERPRGRLRAAGVPQPDVTAQRGDGALVQRDFPLLVLLAGADEDHTVAQVDIVAVQRQRLAWAHRGDREQPDQRLMTHRPQRRRQQPGSRDQRRDLLTGVDVGRDPWPICWQQVRRRDLAVRVGHGQMAGEPARDGQPLTPIGRVRLPRQPGPLQRQVRGDTFGAGLLEEAHEPFQQAPVLRHREPEPVP